MTTSSHGAYLERPVFFAGGDGVISGILALPASNPVEDGAAAILLAGGGGLPGGHRNRMWVRVARRLAALGIPTLRFDYHGVGESGGVVVQWGLDLPFPEDLTGAARWLRGLGVRRLVLAGTCFGARTILAAADQIEDLAGLALFSVPLRSGRLNEGSATRFADDWRLIDYLRHAASLRVLRRVFAPDWRAAYLRVLAVKARRFRSRARGAEEMYGREMRWVSSLYLEPMIRLARRHLPILMFYGADEEYYHDFLRARDAGLSRLLEQADGAIEVRTVPGVIHGYTTLAAQRITMEQALSWITARLAPDRLPAAEMVDEAETVRPAEMDGRVAASRESRVVG